MSTGATIVWFRQDLRLNDNPALHAAAAAGQAVIPVYIWSPGDEGDWVPGAASRWWLHQSLGSLDQQLRNRGSRLILAQGPTLKVLRKLAAETGATAVHWNRRFEPAAVQCSNSSHGNCRVLEFGLMEFNGSLLSDPTGFLNKSGKPYQVYTAFRRGLLHDLDPGPVLSAPRKLRKPSRWPKSEPVELAAADAEDQVVRSDGRPLASRRNRRPIQPQTLSQEGARGLRPRTQPSRSEGNVGTVTAPAFW